MSYCHLVGGVGIDFNLGFGPLPGDRIRSEVYNASCLTSCDPPCDDADNDGVCDADDVCPGFDDNLLGMACNDGDACTVGETWTACNTCGGGTFADDDGDGVCNANDVCPGGDDNVDLNNNGTPDFCECSPATTNFASNPLTSPGNGSNSTTVTFAAGDKNPSFTISGMNAKINGNPNSRYIEQVTVAYVNGNGNTQTHGTYGGDQFSSVTVNISGLVQSVTVSLTEGYDGNYEGNLSVNLSTIDYCIGTPPCADADNDGVCDGDDVCPGFDDNLLGMPCDDGDACTEGETWTSCGSCTGGTYVGDDDGDTVCNAEDQCPGEDDLLDANNNGTPDCLEGTCTTTTSPLNPNPLTHSGTGSSSASVSFPGGNEGAAFIISNLDEKQNGNPSKKYIEQVTVTYVDGAGSTQTYGVFSGANQSTVDVNIAGAVQSVSISLTNIHPDNPPSANMSVDMTAVTHCVPAGGSVQGGGPGEVSAEAAQFTLYPNPAQQQVFLRFDGEVATGELIVTNTLGVQLGRYPLEGQPTFRLDLREQNIGAQMLLITFQVPGQKPITKRLMVID